MTPFTQVLSEHDINVLVDDVNKQLTILFAAGYTAHISLAYDDMDGAIFAVLEPVQFTTKRLLFGVTYDEKQYQVNGIYGKGAARSHGWLLINGIPLFYGMK